MSTLATRLGRGVTQGQRELRVLATHPKLKAVSAISWRVLVVFVPLFLVCAIILGGVTRTQQDALRDVISSNQKQAIAISAATFQAILNIGIEDVRFLSNERFVTNYIDGTASDSMRRDIESHFLALAQHRNYYDQIRLLNVDGHEKLRIYRSAPTRVHLAEESKLPVKSHRYYFNAINQLGVGGVYVSPLDLNIENGQIEQPIKPTFRFGSALFDNSGKRAGSVVTNYNAKLLLTRVRQNAAAQNFDIWLVNSDGYWLLGPREEADWAFMYEDRAHISLANEYPEMWSKLQAGPDEDMNFEAEGGIFNFTTVSTLDVVNSKDNGVRVNDQKFHVVAFLPPQKLQQMIDKETGPVILMWSVGMAGLGLLSIIVGYSWYLSTSQKRVVRQLNRQLRDDNRALSAINKELEAFSYSVSHDLRTPLRSIDGFSQALAEDFGDELGAEGRHYVERVRASAQRMGELIDGLLVLARLTRAELKPEDADMMPFIDSMIAHMTEDAPDRHVDWVLPQALEMHGDPAMIRIVFENLISNAWKFTSNKQDARIEIGTSMSGGQIVYHVKDNGAGFDMSRASKLFGAFQRLHTTQEFPGNGVGLATVKRIISKHGGRIWAEAKPGEGASFYFTLGAVN